MFVHWGPVSLTGLEISWSRANSNPKCPNRGSTPVEVYDQLYRQFNPTNFNAAGWAETARAAGMKYLVLTAKHCDGFLLWPSKVDPYTIAQTPFRRDICREVADATRAAGLKLGWYFSPMDWRDPDFRTDRNAAFVARMQGEVGELLANYGRVDLLWFDWDSCEPLYDQATTYSIVRRLQPEIIINNRLDLGAKNNDNQILSANADYYTPEQRIGRYDDQLPWETCMTLGTQWSWKPNDAIKSLREVVGILARTVGGDGNLLLNVGPMPDGRIEPRQVDVLRQVGSWIRTNGESIYGTRGGPFKPSPFLASTRKGNAVYVLLLRTSEETLALPPLSRKILRSEWLHGGEVPVTQTDAGITLTVGRLSAEAIAPVVRLTLDGPADGIPSLDVPRPGIIQPGMKATASNVFQNDAAYRADRAIDGDDDTRWATDAGTKSAWLEVDLGKPMAFARVEADEAYPNRVQSFELLYRDGTEWKVAHRGTTLGTHYSARFKPVTAQHVRLHILNATDGPTIHEFQLYAPGSDPMAATEAEETETTASPESAELHGIVRRADTGQPVACTVTITDATGQTVTEGAGLRIGFRCPGEFRKLLPAGRTRIRVTRGPEYHAVESVVDLPPGGARQVVVILDRQVDLRRRGWYAGDSHAHMIHGEQTVPVDFDQVALAAQAEDLHYLSLSHAWALDDPTPERLEAELSRRSTPDCVLTWNLEAPKNYYLGDAGRCLGHCWNLGIKGRTAKGDNVIDLLLQASAADYESRKPSIANFESHALIHAQGGKVFYTHPARWWTGPWGGQGGYPKQEQMRVSNMAVELPLDTLIGPTFDGLDVITGAGEVAADRKTFEIWSLLLNHGYRVAATASSDACFDRPGGAVPGSARLYTFIKGPFSIAAAARAAAAGRTFATTGPLLLASVDGLPPGSAFRADGQPHALRIEAWSSGATTGGLARIEVLRNGASFQQHPLSDRPTSWATNLSIPGDPASWYCVRAFGANEGRQRAISGAFFFDERQWRRPEPVSATVRVRVEDADGGRPLKATLAECQYVGTQPRRGKRHRFSQGTGVVTIPATSRLQAEAKGYEPLTLSPVFDHPALIELITRLEDKDLADWRTFERIQTLLGQVPLTFRLKRRFDG